MSTTLKYKEVTSRKQHKCFSCLRIFPPRTKLRYWVGIYDGDFGSVYNCVTCDEIMKRCNDDGEGYPQGFVQEMLEKGQTPEQLLKEWKSKK